MRFLLVLALISELIRVSSSKTCRDSFAGGGSFGLTIRCLTAFKIRLAPPRERGPRGPGKTSTG